MSPTLLNLYGDELIEEALGDLEKSDYTSTGGERIKVIKHVDD